MQQFHPIIYSVHDGGAFGRTVEANDAEEACRKAAADIMDVNLTEVDRMFERHEIEVIVVIEGDLQFQQTKNLPLFPGI